MNFRFSREENEFRSEVRAFVEPYRGLEGFFRQDHCWPEVKSLFQAMAERGWLSLAWPREEGGLARPPSYEYLLWEEVGYARAARNPLAAGVVARTLIRYGSQEQKERFLPPIRSGDLHFSLGYSEPEAGSDLASLRCRARRRGDVYVIEGQKCWQSYAQDMDYLWLLCRTGSQESRGAGLTLLMVDLAAPGVTVRPLPLMDGEQLNEVYLEGVEVPATLRVGPEDGAWKMMGEALADERHIQFPPGRVRRDLEEVWSWCREHGLADEPVLRSRLEQHAVEVLEVEAAALAVLDAMQKGRPTAIPAAASKMVHTRVAQAIARTAMDHGGPAALVSGARPQTLWLQSMWETIGGGTTEIMRGMVAKQALGLGGRR